MKIRHLRIRVRALTMIEVLVVVAVLVVLAAMLLPATTHCPASASKIFCVNNLKQIGVGLHLFRNDELFPMEISTNDGGTREWVDLGNVVPHLRVLSNELNSPKTLGCPDDKTRRAATNFQADLRSSNISYFVGVDATRTNETAFLSGDRNITNGAPTRAGLVEFTTSATIGWTKDIHKNSGNILFSDGHVEGTSSSHLRDSLRVTGLATNRLAMP